MVSMLEGGGIRIILESLINLHLESKGVTCSINSGVNVKFHHSSQV